MIFEANSGFLLSLVKIQDLEKITDVDIFDQKRYMDK